MLENLFPETKHFENRGRKELIKKFREPVSALSQYDVIYEVIKDNMLGGTGRAVQLS
jgi:hypothetical protein